jgi:cell wall-associated NlpC family hydrolase
MRSRISTPSLLTYLKETKEFETVDIPVSSGSLIGNQTLINYFNMLYQTGTVSVGDVVFFQVAGSWEHAGVIVGWVQDKNGNWWPEIAEQSGTEAFNQKPDKIRPLYNTDEENITLITIVQISLDDTWWQRYLR